MLVIHVYVQGKSGAIERSYDLMQSNGTDDFTGVDMIIPYNNDFTYPLTENDAILIASNQDFKGDH